MDQVSWTESERVFFDIPNFFRRFLHLETSGREKHWNTVSHTSLRLSSQGKMTQQQGAELHSRLQHVRSSDAGDRHTWVCTSLSLDDPGQASTKPQFSLKWGLKTGTPTAPHP